MGMARRFAPAGFSCPCSIDHAPGAHDDLANVIAGVALLRCQPLYVERVGAADLARDQRSRAVDLGH